MANRRSAATELSQALLLLGVLLPLAFFPGLINLYRLPKEVVLAFLTAVLAWMSVVHLRRAGTSAPGLPLVLPLALFLLFPLLSLVSSANPVSGLLRWLQLCLWVTLFWAVVLHLGRSQLERLAVGFVLAGSLVSLLGIAQQWGMDLPSLIQIAAPSSTFGNKNMAAQYLLFLFPLAFYLLLSTRRPAREWTFAAAAALLLTYLVYTGTRAVGGGSLLALGGLALGLLLRGHDLRGLLRFETRKWRFLGAVGLFVVAMNLFPPYLVPGWSIAGYSSALERLVSMAEVERHPSYQVRFVIWANALAMARDHSFLGVGLGNFEYLYPLYNRAIRVDPTFSAHAKAEEAHNDYVQTVAETGVLGISSFLLVLFLLLRRAWDRLGESADSLLLAISFSLAAMLVVAFWDFPFQLPVSGAFFWIFAGMLWVVTEPPEPLPEGGRRGRAWMPMAFLALAATIAAVASLAHLRAEFFFSRAIYGEYEVETLEEKLGEAEKDFQRAMESFPYDYRYPHWMGILLLRRGKPVEALQVTGRALSLNPYSINTLNNLGILYRTLGDSARAIQAFETALKIWPEYLKVHNQLGQIYVEIGEEERAVQHFRESLRIDPENEFARSQLLALGQSP